ncbi:MAG: hypothetical protein E7471_02345 [Ruminococcaceae bacterium]|nr:hypothetical protein [Oscillospiraceae bacterium]
MTPMNHIVPQPQSLSFLSDHTICIGTSVLSNIFSEHPAVKNAFRDISYFLSRRVCRPCVSAGTTVYLELSDTPPAEMIHSEEGYSITTSYERITVTGYGPVGLYYGVLSLIELAEPHGVDHYVPHIEINDWPACKTRGLMINASADTQFTTFENLKKTIDSLSKRKMNTLLIHMNHSEEFPADFLQKIIAHGSQRCVSVLPIHDLSAYDMSKILYVDTKDISLDAHAESVWRVNQK